MRHYRAGVAAAVSFILFFLCVPELYSAVNITGSQLGLSFGGERNRSFSYSGIFSLFGSIELQERYTLNSGFSLGFFDNTTEIKAFSSGQMAVFTKKISTIPLYANLDYRYHGLTGSEYIFHSHAVLPSLALNGRWAGFSLGCNFRFCSFFSESFYYEPALAFLGYVNFINNEKLRVGLSLANYNDFYMGNMGAYFLKLDSDIHITGQWTVYFEVEMIQSGGDGLTTTFYGIAYRGGLKFVW